MFIGTEAAHPYNLAKQSDALTGIQVEPHPQAVPSERTLHSSYKILSTLQKS